MHRSCCLDLRRHPYSDHELTSSERWSNITKLLLAVPYPRSVESEVPKSIEILLKPWLSESTMTGTEYFCNHLGQVVSFTNSFCKITIDSGANVGDTHNRQAHEGSKYHKAWGPHNMWVQINFIQTYYPLGQAAYYPLDQASYHPLGWQFTTRPYDSLGYTKTSRKQSSQHHSHSEGLVVG